MIIPDSRSVIIDKDLLQCDTNVIIPDDIIVNSGGIYDRHVRNCVGYAYSESDPMTKLLLNEIEMLLEHIKKMECKYNVYPTECYIYDEYRSALLYKFKNTNEKQLIYSILCICIDRGLAITHNNVLLNNTGSDRIQVPMFKTNPTFRIDNELENFYYSKKGKWVRLTGIYDTIEMEQQRARLVDWPSDCRILVSW
jgi:hypothetical protein